MANLSLIIRGPSVAFDTLTLYFLRHLLLQTLGHPLFGFPPQLVAASSPLLVPEPSTRECPGLSLVSLFSIYTHSISNFILSHGFQ